MERPKSSAGFTLVEVLVVAFIIGLLSTAAVLSLGGESDGLRREAERLTARLRLAAEDALVTGEPAGLSIDDEAYGFVKFRRGLWVPLAGEARFARQAWENGTVVEISRDGEDLNARRDIFGQRDAASGPPVYFDPIGLSVPFVLTLRRDGAAYRITGDYRGTIELNSLTPPEGS